MVIKRASSVLRDDSNRRPAQSYYRSFFVLSKLSPPYWCAPLSVLPLFSILCHMHPIQPRQSLYIVLPNHRSLLLGRFSPQGLHSRTVLHQELYFRTTWSTHSHLRVITRLAPSVTLLSYLSHTFCFTVLQYSHHFFTNSLYSLVTTNLYTKTSEKIFCNAHSSFYNYVTIESILATLFGLMKEKSLLRNLFYC